MYTKDLRALEMTHLGEDKLQSLLGQTVMWSLPRIRLQAQMLLNREEQVLLIPR